MSDNLEMLLLSATPYVVAYEGTVESYPDAYIPEMWANESVAILEENMVAGNLVHRDFEPILASYGDVVNTRKPGEFTAYRKTTADNVTVQSPTATSIPVVLNQHLHTSFMIKDGDQSKSFKDLTTEYLAPAMLSLARAVDQIVLAQVFQFLGNGAGQLGGIGPNTAEAYMLGVRQVLNVNKAYVDGRNLILGTTSETALLQDKTFTQAYSVGDDGTALKEASLGRKYGFDIFMAQNTPYVSSSFVTDTVTVGLTNLVGGYPAGTKTFTVDGFVAAIPAGSWFTIAGDGTPLRVVSTVGGATPTSITADRPILNAVADDAAITLYKPGLVANTAGYAAGWGKAILFDGITNPPQVGQYVSFPGGEVYGIIQVDTSAGSITLDRPTETALSDEDNLFFGPAGSYNLAFHRNAISLVTRPLALPMQGSGARAGIANFNGLSMRTTFSYNGLAQGTLVTLDTLLGIKVLDSKLGAVMYG